MNISNKAGQWIKETRESRSITQTDLAEAVDLGDRTILAKIETGVRQLSLQEFVNICKYLELEPAEILNYLLQ